MNQMQEKITVNNKDYTIISQIGSGAAGKVFKVLYQNEYYAIKRQEYFGEGELQLYKKLFQEHKKCRNLIKIYDFQQNGRFSYIVMELGDCSLLQALNENKIDKKNIRFIIKEIATGIKELHDFGLAHRDLKPENILVKTIYSEDKKDQQQVFKICDFGVIKDSSKLQTQAVGTPYYQAPELLTNTNELYQKKCDIWSFGALIYEILTKTLMFQGQTIEELRNAILQVKDQDIQTQIDKLQIDTDYKELLKNMLKVNVQQRYDIDAVLRILKPKSRSVSRQRQYNIITNNPQQISIRNQFYGRPNQLSQSPLKETQNQKQDNFQQNTKFPNCQKQYNQFNYVPKQLNL